MRVYLAGAVLLLAASGCGVLSHGNEGVRPVTEAELAAMVVPERVLLQRFPRLERDGESGTVTAQEAADGTIDRDDTASSIKHAGWQRGYLMGYFNPHGKGLVSVNSSVDLFESAGAARAVAVKDSNAAAVQEGLKIGGAHYKDLKLYDPAVGEEAWGIEYTVGVGKTNYYISGVLFRRGRIIGGSVIVRTDMTTVRAQVLDLAQLTDERIHGVLAGELEVPPLLPERDPRSLIMHRGDFSLRLSLAHQGYVKNGGVRAYLQEFDVTRGRLGHSKPMYVKTLAQVYPTVAAAKRDQRYFESDAGRAAILKRYLKDFLEGSFEPRKLESAPVRVGGRDAAAFTFSFAAPNGRVRGVMVTTRVGKARGNLTVLGWFNDIRPADALTLVPRMRVRLGG